MTPSNSDGKKDFLEHDEIITRNGYRNDHKKAPVVGLAVVGLAVMGAALMGAAVMGESIM